MKMNYARRVKFWMRNGFSTVEAMVHGKHEFPREVWVALKRLRIENQIKKRAK